MPLEQNLVKIDEMCPDCGVNLEEDEHDRLWCRNCGEAKSR